MAMLRSSANWPRKVFERNIIIQNIVMILRTKGSKLSSEIPSLTRDFAEIQQSSRAKILY